MHTKTELKYIKTETLVRKKKNTKVIPNEKKKKPLHSLAGDSNRRGQMNLSGDRVAELWCLDQEGSLSGWFKGQDQYPECAWKQNGSECRWANSSAKIQPCGPTWLWGQVILTNHPYPTEARYPSKSKPNQVVNCP